MLKRLRWFTAGVVAGVVGAAYTYSRVRELRDRSTADQLADVVAVGARKVGGRVRDAVVEGRQAMRAAEDELERGA
jgi:hypothetical protein